MTFEQLNDVIAVVENETFLEAAECRNMLPIHTVQKDYEAGERTGYYIV